ncbi:hypothetical protein GCM10022214_09870 [Actinomadura miaoliensis]|uniref:Uncharacterized protein n=1 Tax=Actinomadura miaoliensis TaxID=430685 RepID=A0ABP7V4H0_9ACTN
MAAKGGLVPRLGLAGRQRLDNGSLYNAVDPPSLVRSARRGQERAAATSASVESAIRAPLPARSTSGTVIHDDGWLAPRLPSPQNLVKRAPYDGGADAWREPLRRALLGDRDAAA